MTSRIIPTNIDITYPIAGQDNDTQGFRDNFAGIQTNFQIAGQEISALQTVAAASPQFVTAPFGTTAPGTAGQIAYAVVPTVITAQASFSGNNYIQVNDTKNLGVGMNVVFSTGTAITTLTANYWTPNTTVTTQQIGFNNNVYTVTGNVYNQYFANLIAPSPTWYPNIIIGNVPTWTSSTNFANLSYVFNSGNSFLVTGSVFGSSFTDPAVQANVTFAFPSPATRFIFNAGNTFVIQGSLGNANLYAPSFANISANNNPVWTAGAQVTKYGLVYHAPTNATYRVIKDATFNSGSITTDVSNGNLALAFVGNSAVQFAYTGNTAATLFSTNTGNLFQINSNCVGNLTPTVTYYITSIPNSTQFTVGNLQNASQTITLTNTVGVITTTVSSAYLYICVAANNWVRVPLATWVGN
jgi:hypothetical protein